MTMRNRMIREFNSIKMALNFGILNNDCDSEIVSQSMSIHQTIQINFELCIMK